MAIPEPRENILSTKYNNLGPEATKTIILYMTDAYRPTRSISFNTPVALLCTAFWNKYKINLATS